MEKAAVVIKLVSSIFISLQSGSIFDSKVVKCSSSRSKSNQKSNLFNRHNKTKNNPAVYILRLLLLSSLHYFKCLRRFEVCLYRSDGGREVAPTLFHRNSVGNDKMRMRQKVEHDQKTFNSISVSSLYSFSANELGNLFKQWSYVSLGRIFLTGKL